MNDVCSPGELDTAHIAGSNTVALDPPGEHGGQLAARLDHEVVLVRQSVARAAQARKRRSAVGAEHLHVLDGGVGAHPSAGGAVVRGRADRALERHVRLAAGALVLTATVATWRVPGAGPLAAAVAAGLTLSAVTDTCTMARLLTALPYNQANRGRTRAEFLEQLPTATAGRVTALRRRRARPR